MCAQLDVSKSGYYEWLKRKESQRRKRRTELETEIRRVFYDSRRLYGSPKVWAMLKQQGVLVSQKTVGRIMKEMGLVSRTVKKYKATTNSKHAMPVAENVLNQKFQAEKPNQVWMADITYVPTNEGWLYLASVEDLCTRKIVGFHMDKRMTKELCLKALERAYALQKPQETLLHHSDRGSQYASLEYQEQLRQYRMAGSMSRKGNCYDNACIESFHSVLKKELVYLHKFKTRKEAKEKIFEYITCFYNGKRIHSSIGYVTPNQYERTLRNAA
jgi:transposase InsO family protein